MNMIIVVTPICIPPLATTDTNLPPDEDNPLTSLKTVKFLNACAFGEGKDSKVFCRQ